MATEAKCPFMHTAVGARSNRDWWPNQLNLKLLREFDPNAQGFNYAKEFKSLDLAAVNWCTALGALCFLIGALMLYPRKSIVLKEA